MSESVEQSERDRIVEIWREIAILCDKLNGVAEPYNPDHIRDTTKKVED